MARLKDEETQDKSDNQSLVSGKPRRKRKRRTKAGKPKKRYWSRRPIAEQLLKKAAVSTPGGGITVYFISTAKPHLP